MKNAFKFGFLALAITLTVAACDSKGKTGEQDSLAKADSNAKADSAAAAAAADSSATDSVKTDSAAKDTTTKM